MIRNNNTYNNIRVHAQEVADGSVIDAHRKAGERHARDVRNKYRRWGGIVLLLLLLLLSLLLLLRVVDLEVLLRIDRLRHNLVLQRLLLLLWMQDRPNDKLLRVRYGVVHDVLLLLLLNRLPSSRDRHWQGNHLQTKRTGGEWIAVRLILGTDSRRGCSPCKS